MTHFLAQSRIDGPIWLEQDDIFFLRARVSEKQEQVDSVQRQIDNLERRKDSLLAEIATVRNVLAPVRRIPQDILSEIIRLICHPANKLPHVRDLVHVMTLLSRVCVAWRNAVVELSPGLCSQIVFSAHRWRRNKDHFTSEIQWVEEQITRARSGVLPLHFYLNFYTFGCSDHRLTRTTQLLRSILDVRFQIRLLDLTGHATSFLPLYHLPRGSLPLLEKLSIRIRALPDFTDNVADSGQELFHLFPEKIEAFVGAPRLTQVQLYDECNMKMSMLDLFALPLLPPTQLTSLTLSITLYDGFNSEVYMGFFRQCEGLENLKFILREPIISVTDYKAFISDVPIVLPMLKSLHVSCHAGRKEINILSILSTPVLEDLTLEWSEWSTTDHCVDVVGFLSRCITLTSFTVTQYLSDSPSEGFITILKAIPTATTFRILGYFVRTDLLLQALTCTDGKPVLLPNLTNFELKFDDHHMAPYAKQLVPMVFSRWWPNKLDCGKERGVASLRKVTLHGLRFEEDTLQLSTLAGLDFDYRAQWDKDEVNPYY